MCLRSSTLYLPSRLDRPDRTAEVGLAPEGRSILCPSLETGEPGRVGRGRRPRILRRHRRLRRLRLRLRRVEGRLQGLPGGERQRPSHARNHPLRCLERSRHHRIIVRLRRLVHRSRSGMTRKRQRRAVRGPVEVRPLRAVPTTTHGLATRGPLGDRADTTGKGAALGKEEARRAVLGVRAQAAIPHGVEVRTKNTTRGTRIRDSPFTRKRCLPKILKHGLDLGDHSQKTRLRRRRR